MQVWLRLLIVWCIAIALPVQGVAGATMAHCGASHGRMGAALAAAQHRPVQHAAAAAHHHGTDVAAEAGQADRADPDTATPAEAQAGKLSGQDPYKCSSCASCCAGSALPSATLRLPEAPAEPVAFAEVMVTVDAFASDGPDRPPRPRLV